MVFLGCSQLVMKTSFFTFTIHLITVKNSIFSKFLIFPLSITYNTDLRRLESYYANCTLDETNAQSMVNYKCNVEAPTENIK